MLSASLTQLRFPILCFFRFFKQVCFRFVAFFSNSYILLCFRVFNKVKSRSAHMKSHRLHDAESKRSKHEKPYEKVEQTYDS